MFKLLRTSLVLECQNELAREMVQLQQERRFPFAAALKLASSQLIRKVEREKRAVDFDMVKYRMAREQGDLTDPLSAYYLRRIQDGVRSLRRLDLKIWTIQQISRRRI